MAFLDVADSKNHLHAHFRHAVSVHFSLTITFMLALFADLRGCLSYDPIFYIFPSSGLPIFSTSHRLCGLGKEQFSPPASHNWLYSRA